MSKRVKEKYVYTFRLPCKLIQQIDKLILQEGEYMNRSEFVRVAIRELLEKKQVKE
ncbi:MAG: ribbon-helix-helix domain-containing protein [Candidatus Hodarchaeales archaeon]